MFRTVTMLHFDERGDCLQISVELRAARTGERVALVVSYPGPFEDFEAEYAETYQRAVRSLTGEQAGQQTMFPQDHPRLHLRRSTDLQVASPPM